MEKAKQKELFEWLFGKEINLREEQDITLCPYYSDSNIYYTEEIYQLFQTSAMQRQGKILHLAAKIFRESNIYHTRLEHSKGAYRRCIEFLTSQYEKEEWRKYIEGNRLKGYLVEKIKFMCVHDIGHFMLSHSAERLVGDESCTHEQIGQRIVQEDSEVKEAMQKIKAKEENSNLEGDGSLELFCEGNIDFDRMDYLPRDLLYVGNEMVDDLIEKLCAMCDLKWVPDEKGYRYVYKQEALPYIEKFLYLRDYLYKTEYRSKQRKIDDDMASKILEDIKDGKLKADTKLEEILEQVVGKQTNEISIEEYLKTNDILFLKELINIKEEAKSDDLIQGIMPSNRVLLQVTISLLDPKNISYSDYSEEEKEFIKSLRSLITSGVNDVKLPIEEVIPSVQLEKDKREEILKKIEEITTNVSKGIYNYEGKFRKYNKEEPIYVEGQGEKIYTLDQHPQLKMDLSDDYRYGVYVIVPELKAQGIEEEKIQAIKAIIREYQKEETQEEKKTAQNRMSLFRTQHTEVDYTRKMDEFFEKDGR